jgi:hypothetical protein
MIRGRSPLIAASRRIYWYGVGKFGFHGIVLLV